MNNMKVMSRLFLVIFVGLTFGKLFAQSGASQDIVVEKVGGLPVVKCEISYEEETILAHLIYDVSLNVPFRIHKASVGGLGLHPDHADGVKVDLDFGNGVDLLGIPIQALRDPLLVDHTKIYAAELNEIPVMGYVSPQAFSNNVIELDVSKGLLRLMGLASDEARNRELSYSLFDHGMVVDGEGVDGEPLSVVLSTSLQDSGLAPSLLKLAREKKKAPGVLLVGKPGKQDWSDEGEQGPLINWAARSAVRFEPFPDHWPKSVNGLIGADALCGATVTVWPKRKKVAIVPNQAPTFVQAEQDFFVALADGDREAVEKFIKSRARRRLLDDACLKLWDIALLDRTAGVEEMKGVLTLIADFYRPERRSETLLNLGDQLEGTRRKDKDELVEHALALAVRESGKAIERTAVHDVHVRIGRRSLAKNDLKTARKHLMSAAFGMPRDKECNFWLGEYYLKKGLLRRAWSRYFQVTLDEKITDPEDPFLLKALKRLKELNNDPTFRKDFSMVEAEEYMAGRMAKAEFHAQSRYRFMRKHHPHRVRMMELFVNPRAEKGGGMELAFQALEEFFEGEVIVVSYHTGGALATNAAKNRLKTYENSAAPLVTVDGEVKFSAAFGDGKKPGEDAILHYPQFREAALPEEAVEDSPWLIGGELDRSEEALKFVASVEGGEKGEGLKFVALLCERSVMDLQENGVFFHQFVVREALTPVEGVELSSVIGGKFEKEVKFADLRKKLGGQYLDSEQMYVVGFVQRESDSKILSATRIGFPQSE